MSPGPILIVDDDRDIREALAEVLEGRGFDVATADNGLEALELIPTLHPTPSVILLDLMMPVMDGYAFLEERKHDPAIAAIPVAIITAGSNVDAARFAPGTPILAKPINLPRLVGVLQDLRHGPVRVMS